MHIVEFTAGSLRFIEQLPEAAPADGFVWVYLDRSEFVQQQALLQGAMQRLGGSALLDVHLSDLINDAHPSHYDGTSVYDLVIFRRLATLAEVQHETTGARHHDTNPRTPAPLRHCCLGVMECQLKPMCVILDAFVEANNRFADYLKSVTLEDVVARVTNVNAPYVYSKKKSAAKK